MENASIASMQDFLEISFKEISNDKVIATMPVSHRTCQVNGFLNGGASLALCEICAGTGSLHFLKNSKEMALGIQVSANHLKTAYLNELVTCIATPIKLGKTLHIWEAIIKNDKDEYICKATVTNMVVAKTK